MKIKLKPWNEVVELAKEHGVYDPGINTVYVFGIDRDTLPWGDYIESMPADEVGDYFVFVDGGWWVKGYMVESAAPAAPDDILRYGKFMTDDVINGKDYIRIRLISYNGDLYYHKMADGDVVECRKVGTANA